MESYPTGCNASGKKKDVNSQLCYRVSYVNLCSYVATWKKNVRSHFKISNNVKFHLWVCYTHKMVTVQNDHHSVCTVTRISKRICCFSDITSFPLMQSADSMIFCSSFFLVCDFLGQNMSFLSPTRSSQELRDLVNSQAKPTQKKRQELK